MPSTGERYFNGMNTSVWINGKQVVEVVSIDYTETKQKMPIHGYKSITWDSVLQGESIIQGIMTVNFEQTLKLKEFISLSLDVDKYSPALKGAPSLSRREVSLIIAYEKQELKAEELSNFIGWNATTDKRYNSVASAKVIELKGVVFTNMQQSIVPDSSNILEHYNFIAREIV